MLTTFIWDAFHFFHFIHSSASCCRLGPRLCITIVRLAIVVAVVAVREVIESGDLLVALYLF